ncbi:MAG TPA: LEA type 2 family protein [Chitinophagaceae bacterium]|nr:LEA type 2 family protein [Chitinophagaceae bacterium]
MKYVIFTLAASVVLLSSCQSGSIKDPEYRDIRDVRLIKAGPLQSTVGIDLIYYNPNNFGVQMKTVRGDVYINDSYLGHFDVEEKVEVGKKSEFIVPAIIKLDMIGLIKNQRDLWKKKEAMVRIEGSARVQKAGMSVYVPIKYEGMQNIERLRTLVSR